MALNELIARGTQAPSWGLLESKNKAMNTALKEQQLQDYPAERNMLRKVRDLQLKKSEIDLQSAEHQRTLQPMRDEREALEYLTEISPRINWGNYARSREWLITKNNINPAILPEPDVFVQQAAEQGMDPATYFEQVKPNFMMGLSQKMKMLDVETKAFKAQTDRLKEANSLEKDNRDFQQSVYLENLKAQHKADLEAQKTATKQAENAQDDLMQKQRESRLSIFKLYGMSEFSSVDELTGQKAGAAIERASRMLADYPKMDPHEAANQSKAYVDSTYKVLESIPERKDPSFLSKGNQEKAIKSIKSALSTGIDTAVILQNLLEKGWSREAAIRDIQTAAGVVPLGDFKNE